MIGTSQTLGLLRQAGAVALVVALIACGEAHAQSIWAELWLHPTHSPVVQVAVGDVDGNGAEELVAVIGGEVSLFALGEEGPRFLASASDLAQRPTAVAVADYDGDGKAEIWVGTASPGVIYVYRYVASSAELELVDRARYTWSDIHSLFPLDLDGWGRLDVAAWAGTESLHLFRWTREGYAEVRLGDLGRAVRQVDVADVDGNGLDNLVIARGADQVVVATWRHSQRALEARRSVAEYQEALRRYLEEAGSGREEHLWHLDRPGVPLREDLGDGGLETFWENYIWGTHSGLFVGSFESGPYPDIAVASSQRLLRTFTFRQGEGLRLVRNPVDWPQPGLRFIGVADVDRTGRDQVIEATNSGIAMWSLSPTARRVGTIETRLAPVEALHPVEGGAVIAGPWGFALLKRVPADYVRVLFRGAPHALKHPAVVEGDRIYLSAADWADLTGMTLRFDPATGMVSGIRGFHFLVGNVNDGSWIYDGRLFPLEGASLLRNGVLYFDSRFARMVGVGVTWDTFSRTLIVGS